ncbi:MAG: hypothetical protein SNJ64_02480, partial [Endomicrobiia bacterium]
MNIQKRIEKIISKRGDIVLYQPEKVINSIVKTIIDVEHVTEWIAYLRAKKYFELIDKTIYDEFYNINHLFENFFKKYINFAKEERHRRLEHSHVMERLAIQILLTLRE